MTVRRAPQRVARTEWYPSSRDGDGRMAHRFASGNRHTPGNGSGPAVTLCDERVPTSNWLVRGDDPLVSWCPGCFPNGAPRAGLDH